MADEIDTTEIPLMEAAARVVAEIRGVTMETADTRLRTLFKDKFGEEFTPRRRR